MKFFTLLSAIYFSSYFLGIENLASAQWINRAQSISPFTSQSTENLVEEAADAIFTFSGTQSDVTQIRTPLKLPADCPKNMSCESGRLEVNFETETCKVELLLSSDRSQLKQVRVFGLIQADPRLYENASTLRTLLFVQDQLTYKVDLVKSLEHQYSDQFETNKYEDGDTSFSGVQFYYYQGSSGPTEGNTKETVKIFGPLDNPSEIHIAYSSSKSTLREVICKNLTSN